MAERRTLRGHSFAALSLVRLVTAIALLMMGSVIALGQSAVAAEAQTSSWVPAQAVLPADAGNNPAPYFSSVSCGAAGSCAAVGDYYGTDFSQHWLIETLSDGTWSAAEPPLPANAAASPFPAFVSVSCSGPGFCAAIGTYRNSSNEIQGLIETLSDGTWSAAEPPLPANAVVSDPRVTFSSVSCSSAGSCTAVGSYLATTDYGTTQGLIETLSDGVWTPAEAGLPADAASSPSAGLQRVSCAAAASCTAVGHYYDTSFGFQGVIETLSDGVWTPTEAPVPANAASDPSVSFSSVSCASGAGACAAVGSYDVSGGYGGQLIETLSNGAWTVDEAPLPGDAASSPSADLWSVSCGGTGSCVAVGGYQDTNSQTYGVIETLSNGTWTAVKPGLPVGAASTAFADLYSVWCSAAGSCAAVGGYGASDGQEGLVETLSNGAWNAAEAPLPANAASSPSAGLESVSCGGTGSCAAVGGYYDADGNREGLIEGGSVPAPPTLTVSVKVVDAPMPVDPTTSAFVTIVATVANDGAPAAGATVVASGPAPIQATGTTGSNGQASLSYPVSTAQRSAEVVATFGNESARVNVDVYSSDVAGYCKYPGSPSKLNALSSVLDFLIPSADVPEYVDVFANFISAIGAGAEFIPDKTETDVYGYEITGSNFKTIYALDVEVRDVKTGANVSGSVLYSHQSGLIQVTTGNGGGPPLQQIENRLSCGQLA